MASNVIFNPLLPMPILIGLMVVALIILGIFLWRAQAGKPLRSLALLALFAALMNPSYQTEDRTPLDDIVLLVVDETSSQSISDRPDQIQTAITDLTAQIAARGNTELKIVTLQDSDDNAGTQLATRLNEAIAKEPQSRIAGAILLTDGQLHDVEKATTIPAPLHTLLTGHNTDWDRRLIISNAPAFAILDEPVTLSLMIEDQGNLPADISSIANLGISIDGGPTQHYDVETGVEFEIPITLSHGGMNVIQFTIDPSIGELTDRNNSAIVQINGVRDRLRVLLISGEPHPGGRTWRNLLKSDSSVDLVHFTILRPPEKQDGVPVTELSLIAFPTRELFLDKIDEFDLIIFDRYKRRGILPSLYLDSVREYVENGGAVLISAGPDFASADSIFHSPLGEIVPATPTSRVIEKGFRPIISDLGQRHPVTQGLEAHAPIGEDGPEWGRWFRIIEMGEVTGQTVMQDEDENPLLILNRVGEGRIALLASDHTWLWNRGFEGGGPQLELLRRLAHWMMGEPELEEEALSASAIGQSMTIRRQTLLDGVRQVTITAPDGTETLLPLSETNPGQHSAEFDAPQIGLYRLSDGDKETVIALGPAAPREFEETTATADKLTELVKSTRGGIMSIEDGMPDIRNVRSGRVAAGRGWIGITPRNAYITKDVQLTAILPAWLALILTAMLVIGAWLREGRN